MANSLLKNLANESRARKLLTDLGVVDARRALGNLRKISSADLPPSQLELLFAGLEKAIPRLSDSDRAINNLERLVDSSPIRQQNNFPNQESFEALLNMLATSQFFSDLLVRNVAEQSTSWQMAWEVVWEVVWEERGQLARPSELIQRLSIRMTGSKSLAEAMKTLRNFRHQQFLRIGICDLVVGHRVEQITSQISFVANAIVEATYYWARRDLVSRHGEPTNSNGHPCRFVVLAMGKLGGTELNYSSDIDLVMLFDEPGLTNAEAEQKQITNQEFFERLCRLLVKLIGENTEQGAAYRVDLRLRPNGASGRICNAYASMMQYYDLQGRTWERQALIKAAPIAGDLGLGRQLLDELSSWIYRRNFSRADIGGVKALKRKIERRALESGEDRTNVKTGHGGIRDVEFIIQFLQLLNGGELPEVRTTNTLDAIRRLEKEKCLSPAESTVLSQNYVWLRKLEHRLQMMFDLQTHSIPSDEVEQARLAKRMGLGDDAAATPLEQFRKTLHETTESNRRILNHLLHGAFGMAFGSQRNTGGMEHRFDESKVPLEVDLILDPDPDASLVEKVLRPYGFKNVNAAHGLLMELANEPTQFLSNRRCKHFLASVAPALLAELSKTPDPDQSLVTLASVSDCLGAKGVLWELFNFNPPTLSLYVRLCASSDYLVGILKGNPGMIDELVDALQLDGLPTLPWLEQAVGELTRGATDLAPILHSFKNTQHMRVGIRDILGRDEVRQTHRALSEVAEVCLRTAAEYQFKLLVRKFALAAQVDSLLASPCPLVVLAMGKLGGREPNYHSDLDVIFVYEPLGERGQPFANSLLEGTTSQFFFSELAAAITNFVAHSPGQGRLYEVDSRLRPTGKSGSLAVSMEEFERYFESGDGQLWERQSLCKARPIFGAPRNRQRAMQLVRNSITGLSWKPEMADEIRKMRLAMQKDATDLNLKRGIGGTVDVEFAIQMLQLKHASSVEGVLVSGTLEAIEVLVANGFLESSLGSRFADGYRLLRSVEARLRLMNTTARHDLPSDKQQLAKLAYLLNYDHADQLIEELTEARLQIRTGFDEVLNAEL